MQRVRALLAAKVLFVLLVVFVCIIIYGIWPRVFVFESYCDWDLTAQTWEDVNSNGIRDSDEPPLENAAISYSETWSGRTDDIPRVSGFDEDGKVVLLSRGIGICPDRVQVKAIAPAGYIPASPDQTTVTDKSTTTIEFGSRREAGSRPPGHSSGTAECSGEYFRYTGSVSGAVARPNGDIWLTGKHNGGVTLRRDGKDYSQDIDGLGSYADDIAIAPDGSIWVAGGQNTGVARFDGTSWKTYTTVYGALPSNDVSGIEVTPDGHVWALTSIGPADFNPVSGRWRNYSDIGNGSLLQSGPDNVLWLIDRDALIRFQSQSPRDTVRRIPVKLDSVSSVNIWNAAVAADGSVRLVGYADGWPMIVRYDPSTDQWTNYTYLTTRGSLPLVRFNSVGILPDGAVLLGAGKWGAIRLSPNDNPADLMWTAYPALVHYAEKGGLSVLTVLENGDVWFSYGGTDNVLMCKLSQ